MFPFFHFLIRSATCIACSAIATVATTAYAAEVERVFTVRGIIRAPYEDGTISIQHEAIPNFMPAMTMPFYVDPQDARNLAPGDRVEFEFRVGERSRATKFRKLASTAARPELAPSSAPRPSSAYPQVTAAQRRLRAGDTVPEFSLLDQDNRTVTAKDLRGRHTIVSFIFTRCPVPEFCPLIAKKFQSLQTQLRALPVAGSSGVQLLSISIDPDYDRPAVLRAYGQALGADFARWRFATGDTADVAALTRAFAVRTERNGGTLDHTLATALIGPDGNVVEIWRGNAWKPEEIVAKLAQPDPTNSRSASNAPITIGK